MPNVKLISYNRLAFYLYADAITFAQMTLVRNNYDVGCIFSRMHLSMSLEDVQMCADVIHPDMGTKYVVF
jgi:hypothetical protein